MEDTGLPSPLAIPVRRGCRVARSQVIVGSWWSLALVLAAVVLLVSRWRRSTGVERLQYRWLFMGSFAFLLVIAAGSLGLIPEDGNVASGVVGWLGVPSRRDRHRSAPLPPVRDRPSHLADRDLLCWWLVCWRRCSLVSWQRRARSSKRKAIWPWLPRPWPWPRLFNPVRKRVQAWVDRRFNRSRYNAQLVVDEFAGSLRDRVDSGEVVDGWVGVVAETMQPAAAGVWVRESR